ncbi:hypothetical protein [Micromonospora sp. NPDC051141]|uniref:hypothetical protein n=1 Tax=Micromonospora sp. NPDC051141 TaxID=3364284 RepID=UPI0037B1B40C
MRKLYRGLPLVVAVAVLAACSGGNSDRAAKPASVAPSSSILEEAPVTLPPVEVKAAAVGVADHTFAREKTDLVEIPGGRFTLLTVNGKTVYRFEEDENNPPKVTCLDDCLITWPPVVVDQEEVTVAKGAQRDLINTVKRPDGHRQLTYNGWPLYWFEEDTAAGEAKGEAVGGNWSTIKPDGKPVFPKGIR